MKQLVRLTTLVTAILFTIVVAAPIAFSAGDEEPRPMPEPKASPSHSKGSERRFFDGYRKAYALVQAGQYEAAFAAFKSLGHDEHPDVANYLGYTARKLGRYDESKVWYERALAADPKHVRTWQYYGMWQVEQGNKLKAQEFLAKIALICGNTHCKEYKDLKDGIDGAVVSY